MMVILNPVPPEDDKEVTEEPFKAASVQDQIELLRDGILRLQDQLESIKAEVASCKQQQETDRSDFLREIAFDRQRIKKLEDPHKESKINNERAEKLKTYLTENGTPGRFKDNRTGKLIEGRAARFELLRLHLGSCDKWQLNHAMATLFRNYPGEYCKKKLNKTTWILVERPKL